MTNTLRKHDRAYYNWQRHIESLKRMLSKIKPYDEKNPLKTKHSTSQKNETQTRGAK